MIAIGKIITIPSEAANRGEIITLPSATWGVKIRDILLKEMMAIATQLKSAIQKNAPHATTKLRNSFTPVGNTTPYGVYVTLGSPLWGGEKGYGHFMEFGTRPHYAPIEPLIQWVKQKGLHKMSVDIKYVDGKVVKRPGQNTRKYRTSKIEDIAWRVRAKIAKMGTKEQLFVLQAIGALGIPYKVRESPAGKYYELFPEEFLRKRGVWKKIIMGMKDE